MTSNPPRPATDLLKGFSLVLLTFFLLSCGGGNSPQVAEGGIGGTGISRGPVTAYGSIVVNGVHFDISAASYFHNGQQINHKPAIGEVVTVRGGFDANGLSGTANRVYSRSLVVGPVTQAFSSNLLEILQQQVHVDADTIFVGFSDPASLTTSDWLEVSGLLRADGSIQASLLRQLPASGQLRLQGIVSQLQVGIAHFKLGSLTVDYSTLVSGASSLEEGDWVEVIGSLSGGVLDATRLSPASHQLQAEPGDDMELSGYVQQLSTTKDRFMLADIPVILTANTQFEAGSAAQLNNNLRIEVEGEINSSGQLVAEEVEFENSGEIEVIAPASGAASCDPQSNCHSGSLDLLGISVGTTTDTIFEGSDTQTLQFDKIQAGDWLKISAYRNPQGSITASHVAIPESIPVEVEITAKVDTLMPPSMTLLGINVNTSSTAVSGIVVGDLVEVSGNWNGSTLIATSIERK